MSPTIRAICGILGFGGVAAIAFNAVTKGGLEADFAFLSAFLGGFVFLYAAFFGTMPWGEITAGESKKGEMSKGKWQMFWIAFAIFSVMQTTFLAEKGVFEEANAVVLAIVGIMFALVGVALYFFVKTRGEDITSN